MKKEQKICSNTDMQDRQVKPHQTKKKPNKCIDKAAKPLFPLVYVSGQISGSDNQPDRQTDRQWTQRQVDNYSDPKGSTQPTSPTAIP